MIAIYSSLFFLKKRGGNSSRLSSRQHSNFIRLLCRLQCVVVAQVRHSRVDQREANHRNHIFLLFFFVLLRLFLQKSFETFFLNINIGKLLWHDHSIDGRGLERDQIEFVDGHAVNWRQCARTRHNQCSHQAEACVRERRRYFY